MRANYLYILFFFILFFIVPSLSLLIEDDDKEREDTIYLKSNINEIYASTEITQYFINPLNNPIELIISFPIIEEISLNKFVIKVGEKKVISKVMQREEAEERYDESIYSGNTGFLGRYNDKDKKSYSIHIGNINPKEKSLDDLNDEIEDDYDEESDAEMDDLDNQELLNDLDAGDFSEDDDEMGGEF